MVQCPSCARRQEPRLICSDCGTPLAFDLDLFTALDRPRQLRIDPDALAQSYHELGRRVHPDRFATAAASVRDASLRATALLTRAYRTLRDPLSRGRYWLELNGHHLAKCNRQVPAELAALVFEAQEELTELREARVAGAESLTMAQVKVQQRSAEVEALLSAAEDELTQIFGQCDEAAPALPLNHLVEPQAALLVELQAALARIAYLKTLTRDLAKALDIRSEA